MTEQSPRDTHPLKPIEQPASRMQRLTTRRGLLLLAGASVLLLVLAILGGVLIYRLYLSSQLANQVLEPPPSLNELATQFPELSSVFNDSALDSVYKDFLLVYKRDGADAALEMARKRGLLNANDELRLTLVLDTTDSSALQAQLEARGIKVTTVSGNLIDITIPLSVIEQSVNSDDPGAVFKGITEMQHLVRVRLPYTKGQDDSPVQNESLPRIGVDAWQKAGFTGKGIKVGVLDFGFDGYKNLLGNALPADFQPQSFISDVAVDKAGTAHGAAVAEIIHAIAPDAEIYGAAYQTDAEFKPAIDWLLSQGVQIINHSGGSIVGPFDGSNSDDQIVNQVVANGVLWVNSAGNTGASHYRGTFTDTNGNGYHEFSPGKELMGIAPSGPTALALNWDDWAVGDQDYDLYLLDKNGKELASSTNVQDGSTKDAEEFIYYNFPDSGPYYVAFYAKKISRPGVLDFYIRDADIQFPVADHSINSPGDAKDALTVGAVLWKDDSLEPYSSQGPTSDGRMKPDISAPDGVSSTAFGKEFDGTSASAPHVAGAAALVLQANPGSTPQQITDFLKGRAVDLGPQGPDNEFGYGSLQMGDVPSESILPTSVPTQLAPLPAATKTSAPIVTRTPGATPTPKRLVGTPAPPAAGSSGSWVLAIALLVCVIEPGLLGLGGIGLLGVVLYRRSSRQPARPPVRHPTPPPAPVKPPQVIPPAEVGASGQILCPRCGNPLRPKARFCPSCGLYLSQQTPEQTNLGNCKNCGEPLRANSKFCHHCGQPR